MSSPSTVTPERHFLHCIAAGDSYLIDRRWVRGVYPAGSLLRAAGEDAHAGNLALDGATIPVYELARQLHGACPGRGTGPAQVIVLATAPSAWGLLVDEVRTDVRAGEGAVLPLPPCVANLAYLEGVYQHDGKLMLVLSPSGLHPERPDEGDMEGARADAGIRMLPAPPVPPGRRVTEKKILLCPVYRSNLPRRAVALGLSIAQVNEVGTPGPVITVPGAPPHVAGLTVWRNLALPVIDLGGAVADKPAAERAAHRLVVAHAPHSLEPAAFLVRAPVQVAHLPLACVPSRRALPFDPTYLRGCFEIPNETVVVPDLDRLTAPA
ncbi:hypothetical protein AYO44_03320 [Planctomycetaceae bacterium SCGC AG-212-F19]|nr:hypothetical protein AYO44_03320 [Planctomycetaceae bacterium SCGC AG-212-F19]